MAIIAKYKFDSSLYADYLPVFNTQFTGYIKTDFNNGDGITAAKYFIYDEQDKRFKIYY